VLYVRYIIICRVASDGADVDKLSMPPRFTRSPMPYVPARGAKVDGKHTLELNILVLLTYLRIDLILEDGKKGGMYESVCQVLPEFSSYPPQLIVWLSV
jgi:hypothetical protein